MPIAGLVDRLVFTQPPPPHAVLRCRACGTLRHAAARQPVNTRPAERPSPSRATAAMAAAIFVAPRADGSI